MKKKKSELIDVIIKEPGKFPRFTKLEKTLEAFQKTVGGYIETVTVLEDLVLVCNEEGRILGLPPCLHLFGLDFYGTVVLVGKDKDEFCDCPLGYDIAKKHFHSLWEV